jgi:hypothetical protein
MTRAEAATTCAGKGSLSRRVGWNWNTERLLAYMRRRQASGGEMMEFTGRDGSLATPHLPFVIVPSRRRAEALAQSKERRTGSRRGAKA